MRQPGTKTGRTLVKDAARQLVRLLETQMLSRNYFLAGGVIAGAFGAGASAFFFGGVGVPRQ